ncbi:MAG: prepilin-type N-terminal cleavage/methylation domain-containing protein [Thermodesulfovibrionales bacterium]|nr:prepilin-type N-terminal cleavage/methylation domain-containing protein [Thermodesulfovibrionales bacterium]
MTIKSQQGFSLVEALIATVILAIGITGFISMQASFASKSAVRTAINSLIDAASSALAQCQADKTTGSSLSYTYENNMVVTVTLNKSCNIAPDECDAVTATASAEGKGEKPFKLTTYVCNFK